jgi:hypothetical protein
VIVAAVNAYEEPLQCDHSRQHQPAPYGPYRCSKCGIEVPHPDAEQHNEA